MSYPSLSGCSDYSPKNCSGDDGIVTTSLTCKRIENLCKWSNNTCTHIQGDPCNTTGMNKYGCLNNPNKCNLIYCYLKVRGIIKTTTLILVIRKVTVLTSIKLVTNVMMGVTEKLA